MKKAIAAPALVSIAPIKFRLPKPGSVDPYFGGTRTFWNELVLPTRRNNFSPDVKSMVVKRHPGNKTGIRFIDFQSAVAWFEAKEKSGGPIAA